MFRDKFSELSKNGVVEAGKAGYQERIAFLEAVKIAGKGTADVVIGDKTAYLDLSTLNEAELEKEGLSKAKLEALEVDKDGKLYTWEISRSRSSGLALADVAVEAPAGDAGGDAETAKLDKSAAETHLETLVSSGEISEETKLTVLRDYPTDAAEHMTAADLTEAAKKEEAKLKTLEFEGEAAKHWDELYNAKKEGSDEYIFTEEEGLKLKDKNLRLKADDELTKKIVSHYGLDASKINFGEEGLDFNGMSAEITRLKKATDEKLTLDPDAEINLINLRRHKTGEELTFKKEELDSLLLASTKLDGSEDGLGARIVKALGSDPAKIDFKEGLNFNELSAAVKAQLDAPAEAEPEKKYKDVQLITEQGLVALFRKMSMAENAGVLKNIFTFGSADNDKNLVQALKDAGILKTRAYNTADGEKTGSVANVEEVAKFLTDNMVKNFKTKRKGGVDTVTNVDYTDGDAKKLFDINKDGTGHILTADEIIKGIDTMLGDQHKAITKDVGQKNQDWVNSGATVRATYLVTEKIEVKEEKPAEDAANPQ